MGEKTRETLKLQFDKRLRLEFHGGRDNLGCRAAGLSGTRWGAGTDVDGTDLSARDPRWQKNMQHELVPLLYGSQCIVVWQDTRIPGAAVYGSLVEVAIAGPRSGD